MSNINRAKTFSGKNYSTEDFVKKLVNLPSSLTTLIDVSTGKISEQVLPITSSIFQFTSDIVINNIITINAVQSIVIAVIDDQGKHWLLPSQSVVYDENIISIDISGILAQKNITQVQGTWRIGLSGTGVSQSFVSYPIIPAICVHVDQENGTCVALPLNIDDEGKSTPKPTGVITQLKYTWKQPTYTFNKIQVFIGDQNTKDVYSLTDGQRGDGINNVTITTGYKWKSQKDYQIVYNSTNNRWQLLDNENNVVDYGIGSNPIEATWESIALCVIQ